MNEQLKRLGLTQLARVLPTLLDEARQQQLSYDAFLRQALEAELGGRQQRALERRMRAAHLPRRVRLDAFDFGIIGTQWHYATIRMCQTHGERKHKNA